MSAKYVFVRLSSAKCQLDTVGQLRDVLGSNFRCQTNDTYNLYGIIYYFIIPLNDLVFAIARYSFAIAILQVLEKVTAKLHSLLFPTLERKKPSLMTYKGDGCTSYASLMIEKGDGCTSCTSLVIEKGNDCRSYASLIIKKGDG